MLNATDLDALWTSARLALIVTAILLIVGLPLAWYLARSRRWWKSPLAAIIAMPLVLPPSVLGFYFLLAMGPEGPLGQLCALLGLPSLAFSFEGLVFASVFYSLPFMVQPLQSAFEGIDPRSLEAAATLRAGPLDRFFTIAIPQARRGLLSAIILTFAHTVGEFGVVMMIGGNVPGQTRIASVQIYDYVQGLDYPKANLMALILLGFSFVVLVLVYLRRAVPRGPQ